MTKQTINIGNTANDKKGDSLRAAFQKVNANFTELYTAIGNGGGGTIDLSAVDQHIIPAADSTYDLGTPAKQWRSLYVSGNTIYIENTPVTVSNNTLVVGDTNNQVTLATLDDVQSIPKGDTGATGPQGPTGATGATGATGPQGIQGLKGDKGDTGNTGSTGPQGVKGDTGDQGPTGATGPQGIQGNTGAAGAQGVKGDQGDQGPQGVKGDQGERGLQGPQGDPGATGATGATGQKGDAGAQGVAGSTGAQGAPGAKGDKGDTGTQGVSVTLQGTKATINDLPSAPVNPNDYAGHGWIVTTGDGGSHLDGSLWFWNVSEGAWNDIGPIVGPQGDAGPQGPTGSQGAQGAQGVPGNDGIDGAAGAAGAAGADGARGSVWFSGALAPQSNIEGLQDLDFYFKTDDNTVWQYGAATQTWYTLSNLTGPQGDVGLTGATGAQGPQGVKGDQGEPGATGPAGADGSPGSNGLDGAPGADGAPGVDGASAYEVAVGNGFSGDEAAWLASLVGPAGADGAPGSSLTGWTVDTFNHLVPNTDNLQDIGTPTNRVRHVYVGPGSVTIGNSVITESTTGKLVLPGVTRATSYYADEVEDDDAQTRTWGSTPFLMDAYQYGIAAGNLSGPVGYTPADYAPDGLDDDGYIDGISVYPGSEGVWDKTVADYNRSNYMYAYTGSNIQGPFDANDWVQIPFVVRAKANDVEYEFSNGGSGDTDRLTNEDANVVLDSDGILTLPNESYFEPIDSSLAIGSQGSIIIRSNAEDNVHLKTWTFDTNGVLNLPAGGDIQDSNGNSVLGGGGGSSNHIEYTDENSGYTSTLDLTYDFQVDTDNSHANFNGAGDWNLGSNNFDTKIFSIDELDPEPRDLVVQANGKNWMFDRNGVLTLPPSGDIRDSNGNTLLGANAGGVAGLTGNTSWTPENEGDVSYELSINNQVALKLYQTGGEGGNFGPAISLGHSIGDPHRSGVIAIGNSDVGYNSKPGGVYIGYQAGWNDDEGPQGEFAIAIGYKAARNWAFDNSITLNATGNVLDPTSDGFFVKPIREEQYDDYTLFYDPTTGEVTYSAGAGGVAISDTAPTAGNGRLWYNSTEGRTYVKYDGQWVDASPTVLTPPDTNPTVESITFSDNTVLTTALIPTPVLFGSSDIQEGSAVEGSTPIAVTSITGKPDTGVSITSDVWAQLMWVPDTGVVTISDIVNGPAEYNWAYVENSGFIIENATDTETYTWAFDTDGVLTLPKGTTLKETIGTEGDAGAIISVNDLQTKSSVGTTGSPTINTDNIVTTSWDYVAFDDQTLFDSVVAITGGPFDGPYPVTWSTGSTAISGYAYIQFTGPSTFQLTPCLDPSNPAPGTWYFPLMIGGSVTNVEKLEVQVGDKTWAFADSGRMTFPDGSVQNSAPLSGQQTVLLTSESVITPIELTTVTGNVILVKPDVDYTNTGEIHNIILPFGNDIPIGTRITVINFYDGTASVSGWPGPGYDIYQYQSIDLIYMYDPEFDGNIWWVCGSFSW